MSGSSIWNTGTDGNWNDMLQWSRGTPNASTDAVIDATPVPAGSSYTVTIQAGTTATANSLSMNGGTINSRGANSFPYNAAELELDGTLAFPALSQGEIGGSLQSFIHVAGGNNAAIINGGTINGFVQVEGNLLMTGTNGVYITNDLQALGAGTVTIDTSSISEMTGTTLFDGIFDAKGPSAVIDLGGSAGTFVPNIGTIEGPPLNPGGWTELSFYQQGAINEWNGTTYVPVETTLTDIKAAGTVDVLAGRDYDTSNTLTIGPGGGTYIDNNGTLQTITPGMLNLQAGTVTTAGLDINGGIVQGAATIVGDVNNNGTLIAVGGIVTGTDGVGTAVAGTLDLTGSLTGTGVVRFDFDQKEGTVDPVGSTLIVNSVATGQTIAMNGSDTLNINDPTNFHGAISAGAGDKVVLNGVTATSAAVNAGTLVVSNGTNVVGNLALTGTYANEHVSVSGSTLTFDTGTAPPTPTITGTAANQAVSDLATVMPFSGVTIADPGVNQTETVTVTMSSTGRGTLTNLDGFTYDPTTNAYTGTGSATAITAALNGLVFQPTQHEVAPGGTVTTVFRIDLTDTASATATDNSTSVIATAGTVMPTITGTAAGQPVSDQGTITPFANVVIGDANAGQTETVTVTLSDKANGALSNLGGGTYDPMTGVYTYTGSAAAATTALDGLVFTPMNGVSAGQPVTTGFSIVDSDTAGATTTDNVTSVVAMSNAPQDEFDATYYLQQNPDVAAAHVDPLTHYEDFGWKEGRNPDPLFNTNYYLSQNPDVAAAGVDPLLHYEEFGWKEGRDPSVGFNTNAYLAANPDVAAAHVDPLLHYLQYGLAEGRMAFVSTPHATEPQDPLVSATYYYANNPDVAAAGVDPTAHYEAFGWREGRNPDALFNTNYYLQQNPDVRSAGIDPLLHYEEYGWKEGRNPSPDFSTSQYLAANSDVRAAGVDPLLHYELYGINEGRAIYHV